MKNRTLITWKSNSILAHNISIEGVENALMGKLQ